MQSIINSMGGIIAVGLVVFTILGHALSFVSQVLKDLGKSQPGWIGSIGDMVAKVLDFLNGHVPPKV